MSKVKKLGIVISILCIVGLVLSGVGLYAFGFDITKASNAPVLYAKTKEFDEAISKINISADSINTEVRSSSDNKIRLSYDESEQYQYEIAMENGVLTIRQITHWDVFDALRYGFFQSFAILHKKLVVEIPENFSGDLHLNTNGSSSVSGLSNIKALNIENSSGYFLVDDISCETLSAKSASGRMDITNTQVTANAAVQGNSGGIWVDGLTCGGDLHAQNSSGWLTLENIQSKNLEAVLSSGNLRFNGLEVSQKVVGQNSSGMIFFDKVEAKEQTYQNNSGNIYGTAPGKQEDYTIVSSVNSGYSSLPQLQKGGEKLLDATVTSGSIHIGFSEKQ